MSTSPRFKPQLPAFTLIELLTVIAIIAVLMGLLFPAIGGVKEMARKAQAKNDVVGIVNAVKAYYTEYGKYPLLAGGSPGDWIAQKDAATKDLFEALRGLDTANGKALNPRRIAFMEIPAAKVTGTVKKSGIEDGVFYDPWGSSYVVSIDGDYDNKLTSPSGELNTGAIAWSFGKNKAQDPSTAVDDVRSWQ